MLTAYSLALGIPGCALLAVASHWVPEATSGRAWLGTNIVRAGLINWLQGIVLGVVAIGGAILIRGPFPQKSIEILDDFGQRFSGQGHIGLKVRPIHGALLLARLAAIVPLCIILGSLIGEKRLNLSVNILGVMSRFLAAVLLFACICGAAATWLNQRKLRWPVTTWFAIWIVPEIVRLGVPESPTCRSIFGWFVSTAIGTWGHL